MLVTHGLAWLPLADQIVVIKGGRVAEAGTYQELLTKSTHLDQFVHVYLQQEEESRKDDREMSCEKTGHNEPGNSRVCFVSFWIELESLVIYLF